MLIACQISATQLFIEQLVQAHSKGNNKALHLCEGNSLIAHGFPAQRAINTERFSMPWRRHMIMHPKCIHDSYVYWCNTRFYPSGAEAGISRANNVHAMTADALVSCGARSSAAIVLIISCSTRRIKCWHSFIFPHSNSCRGISSEIIDPYKDALTAFVQVMSCFLKAQNPCPNRWWRIANNFPRNKYQEMLWWRNQINGNIFRVTGPLWGEFTGDRWIPLTKASNAELWSFLWSAPEQTVEQTTEAPVIWDAIALIIMITSL